MSFSWEASDSNEDIRGRFLAPRAMHDTVRLGVRQRPAPVSTDSPQSFSPTYPPAPAKSIAPLHEIFVGKVTFTHSGFRTQITKALPLETSSNKVLVASIELSLQNLSQPSDSLQTRATLNFDRAIDNYVELPTRDGPLRLYLHRDGMLGPEADSGGFT